MLWYIGLVVNKRGFHLNQKRTYLVLILSNRCEAYSLQGLSKALRGRNRAGFTFNRAKISNITVTQH